MGQVAGGHGQGEAEEPVFLSPPVPLSPCPVSIEPMSNTDGLTGLRVAALESRKQDEIARLIEKFGGQPFVSASLREVPIGEHRAAIDFAQQLVTGGIDVMIFLTGVGFRHLLSAVEKHVSRDRYLHSLADIVTICRGPKPVFAMSEVGLKPTHKVPEPNTWRELLATIDSGVVVSNQTVGLQEYGITNHSLIAGLEARGARVVPVRIYQWELPTDIGPLQDNIRALVAGEREVLMFTSAHQVVNLLRVAEQMQLLENLREAFQKVAVVSIGPTTSEMLREQELPIDIEPEHPKMGSMVMAAAEQVSAVLARKVSNQPTVRVLSSERQQKDREAAWYNGPFMKACRREPTDVTPVWLMRQAGRYMAAFREYSDRIPFRERSETASIAIELSLQVCHAWPAPPADGPVCRARHTCHCSRAAALVAHRQLWMSAGP